MILNLMFCYRATAAFSGLTLHRSSSLQTEQTGDYPDKLESDTILHESNSRLLSDWIDLSEPGILEYRDANDEKRGDKQYLSKTKGVKLGGSLRVNCIPTSPTQCNISISVFPRSLSELTRVSPLCVMTDGHCTYVLVSALFPAEDFCEISRNTHSDAVPR